MKQYDLAIAYRIYPGVSKSPIIYADNKLKLSEICLKSFYDALKGITPYVYIILDGCPPEYKILFEEVLIDIDYEFIETNSIGNGQTFQLQMDTLLSQDKSEYIFFAEDDYFYMENAFILTLNALKSKKVDFISPYDHPDVHNIDFHNYKKKYIVINDTKWIISSSTTLTFMTTKKVLAETKHVFDTYKKRNYDASIWISMTKLNTFNFILFFKYMFTDIPKLKIYLKVVYFNFFTAIFGKRRILAQAIPSLATHLENNVLAPNIDWYKEFKKYDA